MRVSVVMATYNGSAHVEEQLSSIAANERKPDELIVVDDASRDDTVQRVHAWAQLHPSVATRVVVNERNLGATPSFMRATSLSTGDIVLFADQDDRWSPRKIGTLEDLFERSPRPTMAYSDGRITDARLVPGNDTIFSTRKHALLSEGGARAPLDIAANPDVKGCTMALDGPMVRKLFSESPEDLGRYWGHDHWSALFAYGAGPVVVSDLPLLLHRFHGSNTSRAVRFNPWSWSQVKHYIARAKAQGAGHQLARYRMAVARAEAEGASFSAPLLEALRTFERISAERLRIARAPLLRRIAGAIALYRRGIYTDHYNGWATMVRDILFR